jgi:hypothetical protein
MPEAPILILEWPIYILLACLILALLIQLEYRARSVSLGGGLAGDVINWVTDRVIDGFDFGGRLFSLGTVDNIASQVARPLRAGLSPWEVAGNFIAEFLATAAHLIQAGVRHLLGFVDAKPVTTLTPDLTPILDVLRIMDASVNTIRQLVQTTEPTTITVTNTVTEPTAPPLELFHGVPIQTAFDQVRADILTVQDYTTRVANWAYDYLALLRTTDVVFDQRIAQAQAQAELSRDVAVGTATWVSQQLVPFMGGISGRVGQLEGSEAATRGRVGTIEGHVNALGNMVGTHEAELRHLASLAGLAGLGAVAIDTVMKLARNPCLCMSKGFEGEWVPIAITGILAQELP